MKTRITIAVQAADFDPGLLIEALHHEASEVGGVATFIGLVRARNDGEAVSSLTLEHYPGMTEKQVTAIAEEAAARWPLSAVTIIHRVGRMEVGERIVFVGTASAHREAALDACSFLMDYLKTRAPFWKVEDLADGSARWVDHRETDTDAAKRWQDE